MKILTAAEMREVDRLTTVRCGVPSLSLMENAGARVFEFLAARFPDFALRKIVVLCGKGNNGGDGFVVARRLRERGARPEVILCGDPDTIAGDAAVNLKRWREAGGELLVARTPAEWDASKEALASANIIVDALLGTGLHGPAEGLCRKAIEDVNRHDPRAVVVAVDIPSGLSADSSEVSGPAVFADYTITFTAPKIGLVQAPASDCVGRLILHEIGSPRALIEEVGKGSLRWIEPGEFGRLPVQRKANTNKGDYGHALIVAGSRGKTGAAVLAAWAALRAGAGLVSVATPESVLPIVAAPVPEVMTEPLAATDAGTISLRALEYGRFNDLLKGKTVVALGPGLSTNQETQQFIRTVVGEMPHPLILDADGLNAFAGHAGAIKCRTTATLTLTPHPGEMARLLGSTSRAVQERRLDSARKAAADWNACVVLKGYATIVAAPDGRAWINSTGNPGMATGGTGDVLTGILVGLAAQFGVTDWPIVMALGVYLHGLAGDFAAAEMGEAPLMASDLIRAIPRAWAQVTSEIARG
jgi:hydroxyethylthiazole kinase-like uncharacterized protein yjeF